MTVNSIFICSYVLQCPLFNSNTVYNLIFVTHLIANKQHIIKALKMPFIKLDGGRS